MNDASSRSHAIFTMVVETEETIGNRKTFSAGKINLVDLAGSERLYKVRYIDSLDFILDGANLRIILRSTTRRTLLRKESRLIYPCTILNKSLFLYEIHSVTHYQVVPVDGLQPAAASVVHRVPIFPTGTPC